jgi:hypothetical protein
MSQKESSSEDTPVLLLKARSVKMAPSPYMQTQILAELRASTQKSEQFLWYRRLALLCTPILMAVIFWSAQKTQEIYLAPAHQAVAIKVDVKVADGVEIAMAEIELPEGVRFNSATHPEINSQRILTLQWKSDSSKLTKLPFAVKSEDLGVKTIKVKFYDQKSHLNQEQLVQVKFI